MDLEGDGEGLGAGEGDLHGTQQGPAHGWPPLRLMQAFSSSAPWHVQQHAWHAQQRCTACSIAQHAAPSAARSRCRAGAGAGWRGAGRPAGLRRRAGRAILALERHGLAHSHRCDAAHNQQHGDDPEQQLLSAAPRRCLCRRRCRLCCPPRSLLLSLHVPGQGLAVALGLLPQVARVQVGPAGGRHGVERSAGGWRTMAAAAATSRTDCHGRRAPAAGP